MGPLFITPWHWLPTGRFVGSIDRGQQETDTVMSVEEKTERCLQLLLLRLFNLELRVIEMKSPLFSPDERRQLDTLHTASMDEDGDLALQQYFEELRKQVGAQQNDASSDVSHTSSAEVWAALHQADKRAIDAALFEKEWRQLWGLL